jgi:hypothetical protein
MEKEKRVMKRKRISLLAKPKVWLESLEKQ